VERAALLAYVVHVDADCTAGRTDFGGGQEDIEACAAAQVDDCFTLFWRLALGTLHWMVEGD